ncbi:hypothetical protein COCVIDRAFT_16385 [Bipolaris victoriae FI3]|uniref:Secreted protein n=1 Tax=Bipolaris victoriae (strain FI3) TaxID=930091 RepID=W7ERC3_BIPV3|nr:hypothetical protein COCVIDRAFT_16385 [Bipolaris victoriae FI3]
MILLLLLLLLLVRVSLLLQPTKRGRSREHVVVVAWRGTYSDVAHNASHLHPARPINTTSHVLEDDDGGVMVIMIIAVCNQALTCVWKYMPWWFSRLCAAERLGPVDVGYQSTSMPMAPMSNTARIVGVGLLVEEECTVGGGKAG